MSGLLPRSLLLFALLCAWQVYANTVTLSQAKRRNIQFTNITTEQGLSAEFVQDVAQDGRGYMWFATQAGLNRYDGHEMFVYEHRPDNVRTLSHSFIWSLHVDPDGILWVGTDRGLDRYDAVTDTFVRSPLAANDLRGARVRKVFQDSAGVFWIGTLGDGLVSVDPADGMTRHYQADGDETALPSPNVIDIIEDRRGQIWVGTDGGGLARLDRGTDSFVVYRHDPDNALSLSDDRVRSLQEGADGRMWVGTGQGLNLFDISTGRFTRFLHNPADPASLPAGQVPSILEDNSGTLWVGTERGLAQWQPGSGSFARYESSALSRTSLGNSRVNAMIEDASGVLWLATHGGVSAWNRFSDTFRYYSAAEAFLASDVVTSVAEASDGTLWVGTYGGGLTRVSLAAGEVRHYQHDPADALSLSDDRVMAVHVDQQDRVWVGTRNGGLCSLEPGSDRFRHYVHEPADEGSISGNAITNIFGASDGSLWVGVFEGGLSRKVAGTDRFERFLHNPADPASLSGNRVLTIAEDRGGHLWVGTEGRGLNRLLPDGVSFERVDIENVVVSDGSDPVSGTPWQIHEATDGTLWIGTLGQGLLRWSSADRERGRPRFEVFGATEGLAGEIYGIVEGAAGELWLSSSRGLFRFEPQTRAVRRFDRNNGLRSNEFNQGAALRSRSGRVLFGGTSGLLGFYPGELPSNSHPPPVDLQARLRGGDYVRVANPRASVELSYRDAFVSFDFVALDFVSPDKNRYRYRLAGFDGDWTEVATRNAIYTSLPPGDYRFEVQASNNDGVWNEQGASIAVRVTPPPWQTPSAYVFYLVALLGTVAWYFRRLQRGRLVEAEMRARLEHLVGERTAELAERNNELQALNSRLEQASVTDALTGLHNRRYVDQFIEGEISLVRRCLFGESNPDPEANLPDSPRLLFVMMIDLDGFKLINDTFGHHAGDLALIEVKERLIECCRKSDSVVRWGGDEFMVLGHTQTFDGALVLAEKVRRHIAHPRYEVGDGNSGRLSGSIGVSAIPFVEGNMDTGTWEQVVGVADQGAYLAKSNGRNAWVAIRGTPRMVDDDFLLIKDQLAGFMTKARCWSKARLMTFALPLKSHCNGLRRTDRLLIGPELLPGWALLPPLLLRELRLQSPGDDVCECPHREGFGEKVAYARGFESGPVDSATHDNGGYIAQISAEPANQGGAVHRRHSLIHQHKVNRHCAVGYRGQRRNRVRIGMDRMPHASETDAGDFQNRRVIVDQQD